MLEGNAIEPVLIQTAWSIYYRDVEMGCPYISHVVQASKRIYFQKELRRVGVSTFLPNG